MKRGRLTEKHTLGEAGGDAEGAKKKKRYMKKMDSEREERRCGEHGLNAAAIKAVILCQRIC